MQRFIRASFVILLIATLNTALDIPPPPPPGPIGPFLNGILPTKTPSLEGSWKLENPLPDIDISSPLRIKPYPGTDELLVLNKVGEVWLVSIEEQSKKLLLDIRDRVFDRGDSGAVGFALHPQFGQPDAPDQQHIFMYYRFMPSEQLWNDKGYNRLSKFSWDAQAQQFDPDSEEILIQQYDRSTWHNAGSMFFDHEGLLYVALGDEGLAEFAAESTQRLDGGFFNGIIRIDVDNDPQRSHPIRRQPIAFASPPQGWDFQTFSQGYSIPNDNPWLDPEGSIMEEFYAIGLRSPFPMYYDPETELIWVADVGESEREEISLVEKGDNLQWPYFEGRLASTVHTKPDPYIGTEKEPYFEYDRTLGSCVIGGSVYYGNAFPALNGKYLFADFNRDLLLALTYTGSQSEPDVEILIDNLAASSVDLPASPGITGVFPIKDGEILLTIIDHNPEPDIPGGIYSLTQSTPVPEPPGKLSDLGAFTDLQTLTPAPGIIPYQVNAPLWSDRALKKRWIAVPNDGQFDTPDEQITFQKNNEWDFPVGTVFIKHFELPTTTDPNGPTQRLETRFFVLGEDNDAYGITYRWNAEGTEAYLLGGGASRDFDIYEEGAISYTQTWDFPSRSQCMSCHTANAGYVLGVKTHQLNSDMTYPFGQEMNQLAYFEQTGMFNRRVGALNDQPKAYAIDDESVSLETRIRSYLDANCASCHRPGGVSNITMDMRFSTPLSLANIVKFPTQSHSSNPNFMIVEPGSHQKSELWIRDEATDSKKMPPLGRNMVDEVYIEALVEWIGSLPEDYGVVENVFSFPNPSRGSLVIRTATDWTPPFQVSILSSNGQLIRQINTEDQAIFLDLHDLPSGMYVQMISDSAGKRHSEQLILQR